MFYIEVPIIKKVSKCLKQTNKNDIMMKVLEELGLPQPATSTGNQIQNKGIWERSRWRLM